MRFTIYWWAKVGGERKKFGHDTISVEEELDEYEADEVLEDNATLSLGDYPKLKNFCDYYPNSNFPEDFGVVKIVRTKAKGR